MIRYFDTLSIDYVTHAHLGSPLSKDSDRTHGSGEESLSYCDAGKKSKPYRVRHSGHCTLVPAAARASCRAVLGAAVRALTIVNGIVALSIELYPEPGTARHLAFSFCV